eukprot:TRINITY_DN8295_c0_g1_i3.p1 TRINITY_DN8295_c0_g1~~TRINITY_DN8295_c0_g1_i3.p1  ORF type:complete len:148 (+),score=27.66 TRINITY_DN8295_c0_g1_i3:47-445(+)
MGAKQNAEIIRPPRMIYGADRVLRVYSRSDAYVSLILRDSEHRDEEYEDHLLVESSLYIFTVRGILCSHIDQFGSSARMWYQSWKDIAAVEQGRRAVLLHVRTGSRIEIPLPDLVYLERAFKVINGLFLLHH